MLFRDLKNGGKKFQTENIERADSIITVSGVNDGTLLARVAQNAFEQIGRSEIEGNFSTADVWSYDSSPDDADLLSVSSGDAFEILIVGASSEEEESVGSNTTLQRIQAMERSRRANYIESLGWPREVAERFAALQDATGFETVFRAQNANIQYDADDGIKIDVNFINFITVREVA